ncbi:hypothetical protein [Streptomyces sp. NPDC003688]
MTEANGRPWRFGRGRLGRRASGRAGHQRPQTPDTGPRTRVPSGSRTPDGPGQESPQAAPGRRVLLAAHDGVLLALRYVLAGIGAAAPEELPPVPNASLSQWGTDGRTVRLLTWGDTAHLSTLTSTEGVSS